MERLSLRRSAVWLLSLAIASLLLGSDATQAQFGPKPPRPFGGNPGGVRMVWTCGNCKRELANGLAADSCPFCGARFRGGFGGFGGNNPAPVADAGASGAMCFLFPVVILVLAAVVVAIVLIATMGGGSARKRRPPPVETRPRWRRVPPSRDDEPVWEPEAAEEEPVYEAHIIDDADPLNARRPRRPRA